MHNGAPGRKRGTGHAKGRTGRIGAGGAGQSSAGELAHRSSAIYASGRRLKNIPAARAARRDAMRCDAVRCSGSVCILTGCMRTRLGAIPTGFVPTNIPRAFSSLFSFSPSLLPMRPHLLAFLSHSYLSRLFPVPITLIRRGARFRGCAMGGIEEARSLPVSIILIEKRLYLFNAISICWSYREDNLIISVRSDLLRSFGLLYLVVKYKKRVEKLVDNLKTFCVCAWKFMR